MPSLRSRPITTYTVPMTIPVYSAICCGVRGVSDLHSMGCAKVSMVITDHHAVFAEPADHHVYRANDNSGVLGYLLRRPRSFDDAPQDPIASLSMFPRAFGLLLSARVLTTRVHQGHGRVDSVSIPAIVHRGRQAVLPAPDGDVSHDFQI